MKKYVCGLCCLVLFSCKFSPTGTNFHEIDQDHDFDLQITLEGYEAQENIVVARHVRFTLRLDPPGRILLDSFALFGNDTLQNNGNPAQFDFDSLQYDDGVYVFTVFVFVKSGTGSLADRLRVEGLVFTKSWPVQIDNAVLSPVDAVAIEPSDPGTR